MFKSPYNISVAWRQPIPSSGLWAVVTLKEQIPWSDMENGLNINIRPDIVVRAGNEYSVPGDELGRDTGHQAIIRNKSWSESMEDNSDQPGPGRTDWCPLLLVTDYVLTISEGSELSYVWAWGSWEKRFGVSRQICVPMLPPSQKGTRHSNESVHSPVLAVPCLKCLELPAIA